MALVYFSHTAFRLFSLLLTTLPLASTLTAASIAKPGVHLVRPKLFYHDTDVPIGRVYSATAYNSNQIIDKRTVIFLFRRCVVDMLQRGNRFQRHPPDIVRRAIFP